MFNAKMTPKKLTFTAKPGKTYSLEQQTGSVALYEDGTMTEALIEDVPIYKEPQDAEAAVISQSATLFKTLLPLSVGR